MTTVLTGSKQRDHTSFPQTRADVKSLRPTYSQRGTMYECVLELLRDIQMGTESNETLDSGTVALIHDLCQRLDWLNVERIRTQVDDEAERTTVIGVSKAQDYTLASLTSSDVANSVADLARHFIHITDLLSSDTQRTQASGVNQDSVRLSKSTVKVLGPDQSEHM
jgi:hypothetical protein